MKKIIIIGGGAAGMALAINLSRFGFSVKIFEKRKKDHHNGLAFLLLPNGFEALCKMGLKHKILQKISPLHNFESQDSNGRKVKSEPMQYLFGAKRHDIVETIRDQVPSNIIHYDHEFSHFEYDNSGNAIGVQFKNGHFEFGDTFIGADGAYSKVRKTIFPNQQLTKANIKEVVSLVHAPQLVEKLNGDFIKMSCKAGGRALGILPCTEEEVVWFFQFDEQKILFENNRNDIRSFLIHQLGSWGGYARELLMRTDFSKSYLWQTHDMDPLPNYHKNNIGLIGDAAHVFTTFTSQGLNTALEDGYDLAHLFSEYHKKMSVENIFNQFYKMRHSTAEQHLYYGRELRDQFLEIHEKTEEIQIPMAV